MTYERVFIKKKKTKNSFIIWLIIETESYSFSLKAEHLNQIANHKMTVLQKFISSLSMELEYIF